MHSESLAINTGKKNRGSCYYKKMRKQTLIAALVALILITLEAPAAEAQQILTGPHAELIYVRGPGYPDNPDDSTVGLLTGLYIGMAGVEARASTLINQGEVKGYVLDAGLRITPKWFGQPEYLFNLVSPYAVIGGSAGWPWSIGWNGRLGIGIALLQFGSLNAEIGYRSHRLNENILMEGITVGAHYGYPF